MDDSEISDLKINIDGIKKYQLEYRNTILKELLKIIDKCYEDDGFINGVKNNDNDILKNFFPNSG